MGRFVDDLLAGVSKTLRPVRAETRTASGLVFQVNDIHSYIYLISKSVNLIYSELKAKATLCH